MMIYADGLLWLLLSVFLGVESIRLGLGVPASPGSGFIPFLLALCLFALSSLLIYQTFSRRKSRHEGPRLGADVFCIFCPLLLYIPLFKTLGYLLATFPLMLFLFRVMGTKPWGWVLFGAFVSTLLSYFFFGYILNLNLPSGLIG